MLFNSYIYSLSDIWNQFAMEGSIKGKCIKHRQHLLLQCIDYSVKISYNFNCKTLCSSNLKLRKYYVILQNVLICRILTLCKKETLTLCRIQHWKHQLTFLVRRQSSMHKQVCQFQTFGIVLMMSNVCCLGHTAQTCTAVLYCSTPHLV